MPFANILIFICYSVYTLVLIGYVLRKTVIGGSIHNINNNVNTTTILWALYWTACVSQHPQSRTRGFYWNKVDGH